MYERNSACRRRVSFARSAVVLFFFSPGYIHEVPAHPEM